MPNAKIDIAHVAKLANLKLAPQEEKIFNEQLGEVLDYFTKLNKVKTENVQPIDHITGLENVQRTDNAQPSLSQEEALSATHKTHNGFIQVEAILESEDR
jgi:aspartyl-tRNA(Asn)/glutamyl-tRNA(Gln) amidotransferase subunit C